VLFFGGFILMQISINRYGAGLTGAFAKLGILVPMVASLILWREYPGIPQWLGIGLSLAAIVMTMKSGPGNLRPLLLMVLIVVGCAEFSNKIFEKYGEPAHTSLFLVGAFATAALCSATACLIRRRRVTAPDLLLGCLIGIPNLFSSWFLIAALRDLPAALVFPVFSAGSIILILFGSALFFGERLSSSDRLAVALMLPALILINL
ncbi:MAG: DMT family transporter, partial [Pseudomonadales bacterium]|nr:DMT family transporter [Pseudomonadales bacterium]